MIVVVSDNEENWGLISASPNKANRYGWRDVSPNIAIE